MALIEHKTTNPTHALIFWISEGVILHRYVCFGEPSVAIQFPFTYSTVPPPTCSLRGCSSTHLSSSSTCHSGIGAYTNTYIGGGQGRGAPSHAHTCTVRRSSIILVSQPILTASHTGQGIIPTSRGTWHEFWSNIPIYRLEVESCIQCRRTAGEGRERRSSSWYTARRK